MTGTMKQNSSWGTDMGHQTIEVEVSDRLRLDVPLGKQQAWRSIPFRIRREYLEYEIVETRPSQNAGKTIAVIRMWST
jgi:hypothetical protein